MNLTKRQREILGIICTEGVGYPDVGRRLYLSPNTVKEHMRRAAHKMFGFQWPPVGQSSKHVARLCYEFGRESRDEG